MILLLVMTFYSCSLLNVFTALEIIVDPVEIVIGRTRRLQVHCSLKHEVNSSLATILSIVMSHSRQETQPKFLYLASVNNVDGKINKTLFSGVINNKGESFLKLTWKNPSKVRAGVYKCEVTGVNVNNISLNISNTAVVRSTKPNVTKAVKIPASMKQIVEKIETRLNEIQESSGFQDTFQKNMTLYVDQNDAKLQTLQQSSDAQDSFREKITRYVGQTDAMLKALQQNSEVETLFRINMTRFVDQTDAKLQTVLQRFEAQDMFLKNISRYVDQTDLKLLALKQSSDKQAFLQQNTLQLLLQSLFYYKEMRPYYSIFRIKYYLSREATFSTQDNAQEICEMFGFNLVGMHYSAEFNFLREFLEKKNYLNYVMTGGSDEKVEGKWVHINGGKEFLLNEYSSRISGIDRNRNCLCFSKKDNWLLTDCQCDVTNNYNSGFGYMCEGY